MPTANRERFLERMRLVFDEAVAARGLGMAGKWVGHPAQLLAVLLAFDGADEDIEAEAAKLEAYAATQADGRGVAMIDGVMSDRATDRHARTRAPGGDGQRSLRSGPGARPRRDRRGRM